MLAEAFSRKSAGSYDLIRELLGRRASATGKNVTVSTSIEVAAVFACMRVIGEGIAQVPLKMMRESADGKTRLPAKEHPLYTILGTKPNEWQTSFEYREMIAMHAALCGNAYSFINRSVRGGEIYELIPFTPGSVAVKRADDLTLTYEVTASNGSKQVFPAESIWHLKGPSWNGFQGLEVVAQAREAIGLSMAIEESQARMQKNGVRASGTYSVEGTLNADQYKALKGWIEENHAGPGNTGAPMVMDRAAKWLPHTMTGVDAQTLETRLFQISEICRFMRVSPIMIYGDEKLSTYAGSSMGFLNHVIHTLAPWYQRIEQSIDANLLTEEERKSGLYANFVEEGLLRGSIVETKDVLLAYTNGGLMTTNEARHKLELNPDLDPASDKLRVPANIVGTVPTAPPQEVKP